MIRYALASTEVAPRASGEPPEWLHIMPWGEWSGHPVGPFVFGPRQAQEAIDNHARRGIDIPIDWDHQSQRAVHNGQRAPAAGWIDTLEMRDDGLWGHVREWTTAGAASIRAREYRYISPVLVFDYVDAETGRRSGCWFPCVALTNIPFLGDKIRPITNAFGATHMLAAIITLLALPEETTEEQAVTAVQELVAERDALKAEIETLKTEAAAAMSVAVVGARAAELGYASPADVLRLQAEVETLRRGGGLTPDVLCQRAVEVGKITPAMVPTLLRMAKADLAAAAAFVDDAPIISPIVASHAKGAPIDDELSPAEIATAHQMGVALEAMRAAKKKTKNPAKEA